MEAMFGSQNTYGFGNMGSTVSPFNAFFPSNSDPFWGNSKANRSAGLAPYRMHETPDSYNYHHTDNYQMSDGLKHVDSGIAGKSCLWPSTCHRCVALRPHSGPHQGVRPVLRQIHFGSVLPSLLPSLTSLFRTIL